MVLNALFPLRFLASLIWAKLAEFCTAKATRFCYSFPASCSARRTVACETSNSLAIARRLKR